MIHSKLKTCRGLKTAWLSGGVKNAPIMMFLHGFPDDAKVWQFQWEYFSKKYHLLAPYIRGTKPSEPAAEISRYGLDAVALDHLDILNQEDPKQKKKIILVGHDLGTLHASHLASLLGPRCRELIIINGASLSMVLKRFSNWAQLKKSWYLFFFQLPFLPEWSLRLFGDFLFEYFKNKNGVPENLSSITKTAHQDVLFTFQQYRALKNDMLRFWERPFFKLSQPTLFLSALSDIFVEPVTLEEARHFSEKPTVRLIEGKHWLMQEQPQTVNRLIEKFLESESTL